ncbi:hypothetical protein [Phytohabitans houttuyneae]|uniref:Uncharacterized protein n=1 Tax=Phytohabitans houttuyneae TaxID=1076126 RepID=A0A6V8KII8_9ACTN|nr:hypothetical protein [Phytohabitans houttuyneae]GFJ85023.1 hypothetical protein Phou_092030 [Phytohabitans houttuyneae]
MRFERQIPLDELANRDRRRQLRKYLREAGELGRLDATDHPVVSDHDHQH